MFLVRHNYLLLKESILLIILLDPAVPERLALGGHPDEVIQALFEEVGMASGAIDEADADADIARGEGLEVLPGGFVGLDGLENVRRNLERPVFRDAVGLQYILDDLALRDHREEALRVRLGVGAFRIPS